MKARGAMAEDRQGVLEARWRDLEKGIWCQDSWAQTFHAETCDTREPAIG